LVVALRFLTAAPAHADRRTEELTVLAAAAADILTTEIWLSHELGSVTPIELNPIMGSVHQRVLVKSAGTLGILYLARRLETDHPKAASLLRWSTASLWFGSAGWNLSLTIRY
jgi:hypothetical protein